MTGGGWQRRSTVATAGELNPDHCRGARPQRREGSSTPTNMAADLGSCGEARGGRACSTARVTRDRAAGNREERRSSRRWPAWWRISAAAGKEEEEELPLPPALRSLVPPTPGDWKRSSCRWPAWRWISVAAGKEEEDELVPPPVSCSLAPPAPRKGKRSSRYQPLGGRRGARATGHREDELAPLFAHPTSRALGDRVSRMSQFHPIQGVRASYWRRGSPGLVNTDWH